MLHFEFGTSLNGSGPIVLLLGAHSDDIEIGCGGSLLRLIDRYPDLTVVWVVLCASGERGREAEASAELFLKEVKSKEVILRNFRDGYLPYNGEAVKDFFEDLKRVISPDIIFTHFREDLHQDHRLVCELTWNTWRDHLILEYEVPKYDGDLGVPNFFMPLTEKNCSKKLEYLVRSFQTQQNKHWFTEETFLAFLRLRGIESRAAEGYAEGFYCRKIVL